jgi:hypothetical protein
MTQRTLTFTGVPNTDKGDGEPDLATGTAPLTTNDVCAHGEDQFWGDGSTDRVVVTARIAFD